MNFQGDHHQSLNLANGIISDPKLSVEFHLGSNGYPLYKLPWHANYTLDVDPTCGVHLSYLFLIFGTWDLYINLWNVITLLPKFRDHEKFYSYKKIKI
jgi:hypothetical protein